MYRHNPHPAYFYPAAYGNFPPPDRSKALPGETDRVFRGDNHPLDSVAPGGLDNVVFQSLNGTVESFMLDALTSRLTPIIGKIAGSVVRGITSVGPTVMPEYNHFAGCVGQNQEHIASGAVVAMSTFLTVVGMHVLLNRG